jgi:RNA polymerase sigma-70 factor (ECF subfamily)
MSTSTLKVPPVPVLGILHKQWVAAETPMKYALAALRDTDDESLVGLVLEDAEYYSVLMARYEPALDRYIRRLGIKTKEDRQDVLQEVFIKAYRNLHGFDTSLKFSSWLYRIAHNEAISWYRKHSVRPEGHLVEDSDTVLAFFEASELRTDAATKKRLNAEALAAGMAKLPDKYRQILILRYFEHKEYEEISDILKIPTGTVGTLLHRGKARLETLLSESAIDV